MKYKINHKNNKYKILIYKMIKIMIKQMNNKYNKSKMNNKKILKINNIRKRRSFQRKINNHLKNLLLY